MSDSSVIEGEGTPVVVSGGDDRSNPEPGWEEGPHLQDPENAAAKRKQLEEAGITADDERLTPDMRALLEG